MAKSTRTPKIDTRLVKKILKMFPTKKFGIWPIILVVVLLLFLLLVPGPDIRKPLDGGEHVVQKFVDGDTFYLVEPGNPKGRRLRLVGADTPETVHPRIGKQPFGEEASEFTKKTIEQAENIVRLEFDGDEIDKYGRLLALVYVKTSDGKEILLNEELIRQGLARAKTEYNYSQEMKDRFLRAQTEAKNAKRGIWSLPEAQTSETGRQYETDTPRNRSLSPSNVP